MLEIMSTGGWLMLPIILCSVLATAIVVERFWTLDSHRVSPKNLLPQVWVWLKNNQLDSTKLRKLHLSSPLGHILAAGLSCREYEREVMTEAIERAASSVIHDMESYLGALGTIAAICPLLGLLGTVTGMIQVFDVMAFLGSGNPRAMADGVSAATIPTMSGMVIALIAIPFATQLDRRYKKEFKTLTQALDIRS